MGLTICEGGGRCPAWRRLISHVMTRGAYEIQANTRQKLSRFQQQESIELFHREKQPTIESSIFIWNLFLSVQTITTET